jgi:hypothetical protein
VDEEQYAIDQELGAATLECIDPDWDAAELIIDFSKGGGVAVRLARVGKPGLGVPSDEVNEAIGKLVQLHQDHDTEVQRITYNFRRQPSGNWKFVADFVYPP